jgi:hypothetical protein
MILDRLHALGPKQDVSTSSIVHGPFVDFWAICLVHRLVWLAIVILARCICCINPVIIRVYSSKVTQLFLELAFKDIFADLGDDAEALRIRQEFFAGTSPTSYATLLCMVDGPWVTRSWESCYTPDWIARVGIVVIVPVFDTYAILIPNFHGGILKYDPILREVIINVSRIVELISATVESLLPEFIADNGPPPTARLDPSAHMPWLIWTRHLCPLPSRWRKPSTPSSLRRCTRPDLSRRISSMQVSTRRNSTRKKESPTTHWRCRSSGVGPYAPLSTRVSQVQTALLIRARVEPSSMTRSPGGTSSTLWGSLTSPLVHLDSATTVYSSGKIGGSENPRVTVFSSPPGPTTVIL